MNKLRRQKIRVALVHLALAKDLLKEALDGERDEFDNQPDIVKMTDGEQMWEYIECLSNAVDDIGDIADILERTIEGGGGMSSREIDVREIDSKLWLPDWHAGPRAIYVQAFQTYGCEMQRMVAIEEMSELIKELCKLQRDGTTMDKLVDELADVEIMIEQLQMMFDVEKRVRCRKRDKLYRLEKRMEAEMERRKQHDDQEVD